MFNPGKRTITESCSILKDKAEFILVAFMLLHYITGNEYEYHRSGS